MNSQTCGGSSFSSLPSIKIQTQDKEVDSELRRTKRVRTTKDFREDFEMYSNVEDPKDLTEALSLVDVSYDKKLSMMKWILLNQIGLGT